MLVILYQGNEALVKDINTVVPLFNTLKSYMGHQRKYKFVGQTWAQLILYRFLEFLSTLCAYKDTPLPTNQKVILSFLEQNTHLMVNTRDNTQNNKVSDKGVIGGWPMKGGSVGGQWVVIHAEVCVPSRTHISWSRWLLGVQFISLLQFVQGKTDMGLFVYQDWSNEQGRNSTAIKFVEQWVGWKHAFRCLKNDNLNTAMRFRSAYCRVLLHVFVDCYPQKTFTNVQYVWVRRWMSVRRVKMGSRWKCQSTW